MKSWRRQRGREGEQIAVAFLQRHGYRIQERNYRNRKGEIDIIAWDGATLVFVEVKAKT
jgi:putative endonuclease